MREKEKEVQQRERLKAFDRELFSYTGKVAWFLPGLFSFLLLGMMVIPIQEIMGEDWKLSLFSMIFSVWIAYMVLQPYVDTNDVWGGARQKKAGTYNKLRYLPVSRKQYRIVRMGYLFHYIWKLAAAGLFIQCAAALLITKSLGLVNVLYGMAILLVVPMLSGWLRLWMDR